MAITLHNLTGPVRRSRRRVGRGNASGRGTSAGKGTKGQRARTGGRRGIARRAMQQFFRRIPKRGGFSVDRRPVAAVTLGQLNREFATGAKVTPAQLVRKGMAPAGADIKVLNGGVLLRALTIVGCRVSVAATAAVEKAGGRVEPMKS